MSTTLEGFLIDMAFVDRSQIVHGILSTDANQIGTLTPHGITYFNTPIRMVDQGTARKTAWTATTKSALLIDTTVFPDFTTTVAALSAEQKTLLFRIIDRMAFMNDPTNASVDVDGDLSADTTLSGFYVAKSAARSLQFTTATIYLDDGTTQSISVPNFISFDISIVIGSEQINVAFIIYLNSDTFTQSYSKSTIKTVVPPLPYNTLLTAPVKSSVGNVFESAAMSANLAYQMQSPDMALNTMSGQSSFSVTLYNGNDSVDVPFNVMYKGKVPTVSQIRDAVRAAITASGVGTSDQWKTRAPSLFITARFYLFPLWDKTVSRPNKVLNQAITQIRDIISFNQTTMVQAGLSVDLSTQAVFQSGYNGIVIIGLPDTTYTPLDPTLVGSSYLLDYFPDFQSISSVDPVYALLTPDTQTLIARLNILLAKSDGATSSDLSIPIQEGVLEYYSIAVNEVEVCLITKDCYTALVKELS